MLSNPDCHAMNLACQLVCGILNKRGEEAVMTKHLTFAGEFRISSNGGVDSYGECDDESNLAEHTCLIGCHIK